MTWYTFDAYIALDPDTEQIARNAAGQVYATSDTAFASPLPVTDLAGVVRFELLADDRGFIEAFRVENHKIVVWKSGGYEIPMWSMTGVLEDVEAAKAAALAAQAAAEDAAAGSVIPQDGELADVFTWGPDGPVWLAPGPGTGGSISQWSDVESLPGYPTSGFPAAAHTEDVSQLRKGGNGTPLATPVLSLLRAVDKPAALSAIGAAPDSTVSYPGAQKGAADKAMPGDAIFGAGEVLFTPPSGSTADTVGEALLELYTRPSSPGGGGSAPAGTMILVRYTSGAWSARPTGLPAGAVVVWSGPKSVGAPPIGGVYAVAGVDRYWPEPG
jgi:hypothetical protein